jgi:hypothetical protein
MWQFLIIAVMAATTGLYQLTDQIQTGNFDQIKARTLAEGMAIYRNALISYYAANPAKKNFSLTMEELRSSGALPSWTTLDTRNDIAPLLDNYRDAGGVIYVFAKALPPVNITSELTDLSYGSAEVGVYHDGDTNLYSPILGTNLPKISTAPLQARAVPDGAPVWVAVR